MKQIILVVLTLSIVTATLFYLGGYMLLIGLGAMALTALLVLAFAIGSSWTRKLINDGARIAIESTSKNDQYDAVKIQALANLTREAIKAKQEALPNNAGYPALPMGDTMPQFDTIDANFTITGLESEDIEND